MTPGVLAIDGPAASGKSSTAAAVARQLGWVHIDSGALYRALTWVAVRRELSSPGPIIAAAEAAHIGLRPVQRGFEVQIDGVADVETALRAADVDTRVSGVAAMPVIRNWVDARLRDAVERFGPAVVDGRDIGTAVFPDAPIKIFLTASAAARAERRLRQLHGSVDPLLLAAETARLAERDRLDATRPVAPLRQAADAIVVDTTALTLDQQVARIIALARGHARS
ncbi:MAG TPA: (d)CMP kinase [Gemmatimonadales bacterium]